MLVFVLVLPVRILLFFNKINIKVAKNLRLGVLAHGLHEERITWSAYVRLTQRVQGETETLELLLVSWCCFRIIQLRECFGN